MRAHRERAVIDREGPQEIAQPRTAIETALNIYDREY